MKLTKNQQKIVVVLAIVGLFYMQSAGMFSALFQRCSYPQYIHACAGTTGTIKCGTEISKALAGCPYTSCDYPTLQNCNYHVYVWSSGQYGGEIDSGTLAQGQTLNCQTNRVIDMYENWKICETAPTTTTTTIPPTCSGTTLGTCTAFQNAFLSCINNHKAMCQLYVGGIFCWTDYGSCPGCQVVGGNWQCGIATTTTTQPYPTTTQPYPTTTQPYPTTTLPGVTTTLTPCTPLGAQVSLTQPLPCCSGQKCSDNFCKETCDGAITTTTTTQPIGGGGGLGGLTTEEMIIVGFVGIILLAVLFR